MSAYLNTRVSIFAERLWSPAEYDSLILTPDAEMATALDERGLPMLALGYGGQDPLSLEGRIIAQMLEETRILVRPLRGASRSFLVYWTERFEVANVKMLLRAKMAGERPASVAHRLVDMGPFARLDVEDLLHAEDVPELFRRLEASPYADIVRHARRAFEESHDPFILEATLGRAYYEGLVHRARVLEDPVGKPLRDLMADLIDRINLEWMLRYRFNYELPAAQVYYLLVGTGYRLPADVLRGLVVLNSAETVLENLPEALARLLAGAESAVQAFRRMGQLCRQRARRILASSAHPLARAYAYLVLREQNLRAVRAVLRGRHLRLPLPDIRLAIGEETPGGS